MSELEHELFSDLMEKIEDQSDQTAAVADTAINPVLIAVVRAWVLNQVRRLACENKEVILATVNRYVDQYVTNEKTALVLMNVAEAVVFTLCPQ